MPLLLLPRASAGEPRNFGVERFELANDRDGLFGVEWAESRGDMAFDVATWIGYANDPLVVYTDDANHERIGSLVANRTAGALSVSLSPARWLTVGVDLPMVISQDRSQSAAVAPMLDSLTSFGVGDLRVIPKITLLRQAAHGIGLAIIPAAIVPTRSSSSDYLGDRGAGFAPELAVSWQNSGVRLAANAGYHARREAKLLNLVVDDELFARAGAGYRFGAIEVDATLSGAVAAAHPFAQFNQDALEALGGATVRLGAAIVFAGGGVGLRDGYGTPDWRMLAGIRLGSPDETHRMTPPPIRTRIVETPPPPDKPDPDKDSDNDGVPDRLDKCPNDPEDLDGFEDADGCPEPDNDHDGLLDAQDVCPREPGPIENGGCPDTDRDGDGVVDRLDNCPDEPGDAANHGCKTKQLVAITDTKLEILESVYFDLDKAVIQPRSFKLLDNVAAVLRAHAKLAVEVQGHTDNVGKPDYNKALSQRRAEAVAAYLVKQQVGAERLTAVGYGAEQPVADNATKDGRAQNRRVVFQIVKEK